MVNPVGRPKKDQEKSEETMNSRIKNKVISYTDYLSKAREMLTNGPVEGMDDVWNVAISLLYSENKVVGIVQKGGETRFVCEV